MADTTPAQVIDVLVAELDLGAMGFEGVVPAETGWHKGSTAQAMIRFEYLHSITSWLYLRLASTLDRLPYPRQD